MIKFYIEPEQETILPDSQKDQGYREVKVKDFMKLWYELEDQTVRQGILVKALL